MCNEMLLAYSGFKATQEKSFGPERKEANMKKKKIFANIFQQIKTTRVELSSGSLDVCWFSACIYANPCSDMEWTEKKEAKPSFNITKWNKEFIEKLFKSNNNKGTRQILSLAYQIVWLVTKWKRLAW